MERKPELLNFIKSKNLMTLSSLNSAGGPQAALVGFAETDTFQLIFGTSNASRKYQNLHNHPKVAVVIGLGDGPKTVQYEGTAKELTGSQKTDYAEHYFTKNPSARQYKDLADQSYFLIEPAWVRYTDLSVEPWDMVELKF